MYVKCGNYNKLELVNSDSCHLKCPIVTDCSAPEQCLSCSLGCGGRDEQDIRCGHMLGNLKFMYHQIGYL